jgi:formylglycine-generating enzyme required for sulfatase activity
MVMVQVRGGTFPMGSTDAQIESAVSLCEQYPDEYGKCKAPPFEVESPQHLVTLDSFWIDGTEVTQAQYALCVTEGACRKSRLADNPAYGRDDYPAAGIPWQDAVDYCAWAGGRLPTEAEWEYAARGAEGHVYPWGNEFDCAGGNLWDKVTGCDDGFAEPAPVGSFPAGASWCGALDMTGNVWEWVSDLYGAYPSEAQANPTGPASGSDRILRGGSWGYHPPFARTAHRYRVTPTANYLAVGFRCAKDAGALESVATSLEEAGDVKRSILTYEDLMSGFAYASPVEEGALAVPGEAALSAHTFEGRLELLGENAKGHMQMLRGSLGPENAHLPEFDYEFVQSGGYFIPVRRGLIIADDSNWNYILGPGRVWKENGDQGYSRASFPFALVWKGSNATFNGTMAFLFDGERISKVWYQITQETTSYARANFWGLLDATYHPGPVEEADRVRADFAQELGERFPTKPITELAVDYPGVDASAFGHGVDVEHMTWYGLVVNGVNYVSGCRTRFGQYAHCDYMRATSYSTAKSAFVSLALMRLAQKHGPEVADLLIRDFVPEYAASPGEWEHVTFDHVVDMATGNYESGDYMADEDGPKMGEFYGTQPYVQRIAAAFDWPHSTQPGKQWVYRTCDTFILTRAMHNYLRGKEGPGADIYQFVVDEIYRPLRVGPGAHTTLRTADDNWQGQAEGGYGLWWIQDDMAKIATLLNNDGGAVDGVQLLHPGLLAAALQRDPNDRGVAIDGRRQYSNAFWAGQYTAEDGFECNFWVPQMLGVSGNAVVLMPNGLTYYYFSDSQQFTWDKAVEESDKIVPLCPEDRQTRPIRSCIPCTASCTRPCVQASAPLPR